MGKIKTEEFTLGHRSSLLHQYMGVTSAPPGFGCRVSPVRKNQFVLWGDGDTRS